MLCSNIETKQTFHHIIVGAPNVPQRSSIDIAGGEEVVVFLFLEEAEEEFHKLGPTRLIACCRGSEILHKCSEFAPHSSV